LEWAAPGGQQLIARLPEMQLGQIGDIAEVRYLYKADGNPKQQSQCCNHHKASDTGNLRIGLFDSNGKGHIEDDGYGCESDIWKGYLGYYADASPHISEDAKHVTAEGKLNLPGKMVKRTVPDRPTLLDESPGRQADRHIGGFGAPLGRFVPLFLKLKRTGPNTEHWFCRAVAIYKGDTGADFGCEVAAEDAAETDHDETRRHLQGARAIRRLARRLRRQPMDVGQGDYGFLSTRLLQAQPNHPQRGLE
jgi:hypothetical protein